MTARPGFEAPWAESVNYMSHTVSHLNRQDATQLVRDIVHTHGLDPATIELVARLLGECSADDNDDAEFDLDALDPFLVGWRDGDRLLGLAGGRPWSPRPGLHDLGVIVHPAARRRGVGAAVVAAVSADLIAAGERPVYRCNEENTGSRRLCRSVGYEPIVELEAFSWSARPTEG